MSENILSKTLSELYGWEDSPRESEWETYVVQNCLRLINIPIEQFTIEDMRLMIGQDMGVEYLLPLVIEQLRENPLIEGIYYEGDVLKTVLGVKPEYWRANPARHREVTSIIRGIPEVPREVIGYVKRFLAIPVEEIS